MVRHTRRVTPTGAVKTPTDPITTEAVLGNPESTGAAEFSAEPVTTRVAHLDEPIRVQSETPGPVTMTVGWLAETKVIEPPVTRTASTGARASAETKGVEPKSGKRGRSGDE